MTGLVKNAGGKEGGALKENACLLTRRACLWVCEARGLPHPWFA